MSKWTPLATLVVYNAATPYPMVYQVAGVQVVVDLVAGVQIVLAQVAGAQLPNQVAGPHALDLVAGV